MKKRRFFCLICSLLILAAGQVCAEENPPRQDALARARVIGYAMQIHDYTWTLPEEVGAILLYNRNYSVTLNGNRPVFRTVKPFVATGTVRGIPYSLAVYGNGMEVPFSEYRELSNTDRVQIANIYNYGSYGKRISMLYGMSCVTFLSECLRQGFPDEDLPLQKGVGDFVYEEHWKQHFTLGKRFLSNYARLQAGDFLYRDGHAVLVVENDPEGHRLRIIEQTPPDYACQNCENITDVTVTLYYRGKPSQVEARRLCMECEACRAATTGTYYHWTDYETLRKEEYRPVFVNYPED